MWRVLLSVNWSSLSYSLRLASWLFTLGAVLYVGLMLGLDAIEMLRRRYGFENSLVTLAESKMRSARLKRQVNSWAKAAAFLSIGFVIGQLQLLNPVRELHDIAVLQVNGERRFTVFIPQQEPTYRKDSVETWTLCNEGDDLKVKPGVLFDIFQYKQGNGCLLLDGQTEVTYHKNEEKRVVDREGNILFAKEEQ